MSEMSSIFPVKNKRVNKFQSPRVDLTPMVDLGFLLLTFFVFSSTIGLPNIMQTIYPDDKPANTTTVVKESGALTLLLGANNRVYYYEGLSDEIGKSWRSTESK